MCHSLCQFTLQVSKGLRDLGILFPHLLQLLFQTFLPGDAATLVHMVVNFIPDLISLSVVLVIFPKTRESTCRLLLSASLLDQPARGTYKTACESSRMVTQVHDVCRSLLRLSYKRHPSLSELQTYAVQYLPASLPMNSSNLDSSTSSLSSLGFSFAGPPCKYEDYSSRSCCRLSLHRLCS